MASPVPSREVVVEGLRRSGEPHKNDENREKNGGIEFENTDMYQNLTMTFTINEDDSIEELWRRVRESGHEIPDSFNFGEENYWKHSKKGLMARHENVVVVADDQASNKNSIKLNETLASHANAHYGQPIKFEINDLTSGNIKEPRRTIQTSTGLEISLERTVRMPDDNKLHNLPASLGSYDLFNVHAYSDRLPDNIKEVGGVFFPMWQREAMWLNFEARAPHAFAIRVFVGRINAVSGLTMDEDPKDNSENQLQDYIVVPGQQWLDGICVSPGIVRQFVAMPLGSGYTVEGQKTSEEKYGGLQLEIIPNLEPNLRHWTLDNDGHITMARNGSASVTSPRLDEHKTPRELGCDVGDVLRSYPRVIIYRESFKVKDLLLSQPSALCQARYISKMREYSSLSPRPAPRKPVSLGISNDDDLLLAKLKSGEKPLYDGKFSNHKYSQSEVDMPKPVLSYGGVSKYSTVVKPKSAPNEVPSQNESKKKPVLSYDKISKHSASGVDMPISAPNEVPWQNELSYDRSYEDLDEMTNLVSSKSVKNEQSSPVFEEECERKAEQQDAVLDIETKNLKAMGLAAGGKLIQDIYQDRYPATTWNHAAARIVHIHILDPVSCEKVTHVVPHPPPADIATYANEGGPFFVVEEKVDERLEGGDFDNVKSVSQMDKHIGVSTEPEFDPTKPKMCTTCEIRLCDCIIRPCDHQFCNVCVKKLEQNGDEDPVLARRKWKCPTCNKSVAHVAGFSAPMNLPGEEPMRMKVPVNVLKVEDGRFRFSSVLKTRI